MITKPHPFPWSEVLRSNPQTDEEKTNLIRRHLICNLTGAFGTREESVHYANLTKKLNADLERIQKEGISPDDIEAPTFQWLCIKYEEVTGERHIYRRTTSNEDNS